MTVVLRSACACHIPLGTSRNNGSQTREKLLNPNILHKQMRAKVGNWLIAVNITSFVLINVT